MLVRADTRNYAVAGTPASSAQNALSIGAQSDANYQSNGYIQDVRVYKGVAKYKGGFDVPKPYTPVGHWRVGDRFLIIVRITLHFQSNFISNNRNIQDHMLQVFKFRESNLVLEILVSGLDFSTNELGGKFFWEWIFEVVTRPVTGNILQMKDME